MRNWREWEAANAANYKAPRVTIRGTEFSCHRFNPNIVAISVVVRENINDPRECNISRIITVLHNGYFDSKVETTYLHAKIDPKIDYSRHWHASIKDFPAALANHAKFCENLSKPPGNTAWRVVSTTHYVTGDTWDFNAARDYNFAYGVPSFWRFKDVPLNGEIAFELDSSSSPAYVKDTEKTAKWSGRTDGKSIEISPETLVRR